MSVDVTTEGLHDLSRALTKKRLDCVKLIDSLNAPPRGLSDLIGQSRAFTEKLTHLLEDGSELSDSIKNELVDDNGFPGHVKRLALNEMYDDVATLKEALRVADGYQPYIVAPEAGLRDLFEQSIAKMVNPVRDLVDSVHGIVTVAADRAMQDSCQVAGLERGSPPVLRFPNFIESILPVAIDGLEELKDEALIMGVRIVEMEQSYVSCSFFRYLTFKRIHEQEEAQRRRDVDQAKRGSRRSGVDEEDEDDDEEDDARSAADTEVSLPPIIPGDAVANIYSSPDAVFGVSGYLEKSSTHSRNKFTKIESSLWQKRFFGVRDSSRTLEYYYSEEAFLKGTLPSVIIQLSECVVSDTDGQGFLPQSTLSKSTDHLDAETQISLLISIQNKDPDKPIYKSSKDLILRAEDAADKYRWLNYIKNAISDSRAGARVATWSTRAPRKSSIPSDTGVPSVQGKGVEPERHQDYAELHEGHGLGSAVFWDPICRDPNNALLPSPGVFTDGESDLKMDDALIQHAADMKTYTRLACETLVMTIPKVIVYCLVDRATEKLGPKIEEHILHMSEDQRNLLLEEDVGIAGHRLRVQETVSAIGKAQDKLKEAERNMGAATTVQIDTSIIELAGLGARLKKNEEGVEVFIDRPKPPPGKRHVTPERRRDAPSGAPQTPPRPQPQLQPVASGGLARGPGGRSQNGTGQTPGVAPRRPAPPVGVAAARTASQNGAPNGPVPPNPQTQGNKAPQQPQPPQQPKQPQGSGWYGFKPFGR